MKIVFVAPGFSLAGGSKIILEYAQFLHDRGHQVTCVAPSPRVGLKARLCQLFNKENAQQRHMRQLQATRVTVPIVIGCKPGQLTEADVPPADVVVSTWWSTAEWVNGVGLPGLHVHFVQGHEVFDYLPKDRVRQVYQLDVPKIVVSRWLSRVMVDQYSARQVCLVENGVDVGRFRNIDAEERDCRVGFVWSAVPVKNAKLAVAAILLLKERLPSLTVSVFSGEQRPPELMGLEWIDFHYAPPQDFIPKIYGRCKAWLFSSLEEGFGLPVLEALASGTPVVATRAGAAPDLVDASNGRLVGFDAAEMADATEAILGLAPDEFARMSASARATAEAHSSAASAARFERVLLDLFEGANGPVDLTK